MRKLTKYLQSLVVMLLVAFWVNIAYGCECMVTRTCGRISTHDAMFLGTAIGETVVEAKNEHEWRHKVFRFIIVESFKGSQRVGDKVDVSTGMGGGDCGYGFTLGERYLVDAFASDNQLRTGICGVTAPEKRASVLIRELRSNSLGRRVPDLSGRVAIDSNRAFPVTGASKDLPGIPVRAKNMKTGTIRRATSDLEGIYTFESLDPGVYELSPDFSTAFTTDISGLTNPGPPLSVTVPPSEHLGAACHVAINVHPTGRIAGTVYDRTGHPLMGSILAYPTPSEKPLELYQWASLANISQDGKFVLGGLRAGGYILMFEELPTSANTGLMRKPLERTYYPGTPTSREASIVRVEDGASPAVIQFEVKF